MWMFRGRRAVVTLTDGSAVRGRVGWSWRRGWLRLNDVEDLSTDTVQEIPGMVLIPSRAMVIVQVL